MYKIDLHTHSSASSDGGITADQYSKIISQNILDYVAITDHNKVSFAMKLSEELGDKIIVGEEIMTSEGEIIGLFLTERVPPHLSAQETIERIKKQGGIVYAPHPLEKIRHGLSIAILDEISDEIDIVEVANGRAFLPNRYSQVQVWSKLNRIAGAASSDAHGFKAIGKTYTSIHEIPTTANIKDIVGAGTPNFKMPSIRDVLYPKYNRLRKKFGK